MNYKRAIELTEIEMEIILKRLARIEVKGNKSEFLDFMTLKMSKFLWLIEKKTRSTELTTERDAIDMVDSMMKAK